MTTETAPTPQTSVAQDVPGPAVAPRSGGIPLSKIIDNFRDYGLVLALILIMANLATS